MTIDDDAGPMPPPVGRRSLWSSGTPVDVQTFDQLTGEFVHRQTMDGSRVGTILRTAEFGEKFT